MAPDRPQREAAKRAVHALRSVGAAAGGGRGRADPAPAKRRRARVSTRSADKVLGDDSVYLHPGKNILYSRLQYRVDKKEIIPERGFDPNDDDVDVEGLISLEAVDHDRTLGMRAKRSIGQAYWPAWRKLEGHALTHHASTAWARTVRGWADGTVTQFKPVPMSIMLSAMRALVRAAGEKERGSEIEGIGRGYPSAVMLQKAVACVHRIFRVCVDDDCSQRSEVSELLRELKVKHAPKAARSFDALDDLPKLYEACMNMPGWGNITRAKVWTVIITGFHHAHRMSEFAEHVPDVRCIKAPTDPACFDNDGLPKWLNVAYRSWKGRPAGETAEYLMQYHRQPAQPAFCPVVQLLLWYGVLAANGIDIDKPGPLFPEHDGSGTAVSFRQAVRSTTNSAGGTDYYDAAGRVCNLNADNIGRMVKRVMQEAGLECTAHSLRVAHVQWCARCGGSETHAIIAGRWKQSSPAWRGYWGMGAAMRAEVLAAHSEDPIRALLPYPPQGMSFTEMGRDG